MKAWRSVLSAMLTAVMLTVLSGCLYPDDELEQSQIPAKDAILSVQSVIDQYQKDTGLLPIVNSEPETPVYEKYQVDFGKLVRLKYVSDIPSAAFEKGGSYYFLIINEETDPTIKLMNLVLYQKVNDIQRAVQAYATANNGVLPKGDERYPGFYQIDYGKLKKSELKVQSVYSGQTLQTMMDDKGNVYIDYAVDLMQAAQKAGLDQIPEKQDLRPYLVDTSDFVPVKSTVYYLVQGEPVPQAAGQ
ncbi:hypothetical protein FHS18_001326 [Paenibacillus phyllosphaerae]|uniref:Lipoprotein n=1 Tax=Paenibacillus phyllosphaerae TaxID=274593 RepID=A0A7W5FLR8_9BACL|nr:hypothetical protein [Paenibacillus phyllosphaerae]MBB3109274.1 hypothetical protein [Paenibacillus phyllosphaerae]